MPSRHGPEPGPASGGPAAFTGPGSSDQAWIRDSARLTRLLAILADPDPLPALADRVVLALSELFATDVVVLLRTVPGRAAEAIGAIGLPEDPSLPPFRCDEGTLAGQVCRERTLVLVDRARGDPRLDAPLRALQVESALLLPVLGTREVLGVLILARCAPIPFAPADVELLSAMALRIGLVLGRIRADEVRHELEAGMRQAQKAESLGRMAGALSHRFNNMLAAATGHLEVASAALPAGHEAAAEIGEALSSLREAGHLSGLLRAYLGQDARGREPLDLAALCGEVVESLRPGLPPGIRLRTALPTAPCTVTGDAAGLGTVVANLITNAAEAISGAGEIVVGLRIVPASEVTATRLPAPGWRPAAASYACVAVSDTGGGIEAAALEELFDPFYTTKPARLGLGLPVAWGTLRAHDGAISAESAPGRGSRFRVFLPLAGAVPARTPPPERSAPRPGAQGGLALVVDDDPQVLKASRRLLQKLGHEVIAAEDGARAVELFRARQAEVRFALLDLTMPGMDGWQVLAALRAIRPGLPVILASGYDKAHAMGGAPEGRAEPFLPKPYSRGELEAAIARALAGPEGER